MYINSNINMDTNKKVNELRKSLYKQRFLNELEYISSIGGLDNVDDNNSIYACRIKQIKYIISNIVEIEKNSITKMIDQIEKHMYKKPWTRLNNIHKTNKVQEYLDDLIDNDEERLEVLIKLVEMVNNNELNTKKKVGYDIDNEKILSIAVLKFNKKTKKYTVNGT